MKRNKNGWGLAEMLVLSGLVILFLLIASFYAYHFYQKFTKERKLSYYYELETKLVDQATKYLEEYYPNNLTNEKIVITKETIENHNLNTNLYDKDGSFCTGYVEAYKTHAIINKKAYIKCNNYETEGYETWKN